jgi:AcrR family transcriptional regulator
VSELAKTKKTPQQKRSKARVALILESARQLLREEGLDAVTTTSIAQRAGIPVASLYQYFPDKKAVLLRIFDEYLAHIRSVAEHGFEQLKARGTGEDANLSGLREIRLAEKQEGIESELEHALHKYPELRVLDQQHMEKMADLTVEMMLMRGSTWPRKKLRRLAAFMYYLNGGVWAYRARTNPPVKETEDWEQMVLGQLSDLALSDKDR